jgi:tetratricopeptide (TPR) repeat protein/CHAT domain-containing protein
MVRRPATMLTLTLLLTVPAPAHDLPRPTEAGGKALDELIRSCVDAGGLKPGKDPANGSPSLAVADPDALRRVARARRDAWNAELRDTLVARCGVAGGARLAPLSVLLQAAGEAAGDERALAFACYFGGATSRELSRPAEAKALYGEARERFARLGDRAWEATCRFKLGVIAEEQRDHRRALEEYEHALKLRRQALGGDHPEVARVLHNQAIIHSLLGDPTRARIELEQALKIYRNAPGPHREDIAFCLANMAEAEYARGRYAEALRNGQEALRLWRESRGPEDLHVAQCLNNIGTIDAALGKPEDALRAHRESLAIRRKQLGERHPDVADSLDNIAAVYQTQGDLRSALENRKQALAIRTEAFGGRHPDVADSLNNLGSLYSEAGDHTAAREHFSRALAIRRAEYGDEHPLVAASYNNLAAAEFYLGRPRDSLENFERALTIKRALYRGKGPHPDLALALNNAGFLHDQLGDPTKALGMYREALTIRRAALGPEHPDVAHSLHNIGALLERLGELTEALACCEQSLAIWTKRYGERHADVANSLNTIASIHSHAGRYETALRTHQRALAVRRAVYGDRHEVVANSYINLGATYHEIGEDVIALENHRKALAILRSVKGERDTEVGRCHNNIGAALAALGDRSRAREEYGKALAIWSSILGETHPQVAYAHGNIAGLLDDAGDHDAAIAEERKVLAIRRAAFGDRHPDVARAHYNLGGYLSHKRSYDLAIREYAAALEVWLGLYGEHHPLVAACLNNLGGAHADRGDAAVALRYIDRGLDASREDPRTPLPAVGKWSAGLFVPSMGVINPLQLRANLMRTRLKSDSPLADVRDCLRVYEVAAEALERYRERVLQSDPSKLRIGESNAELCALTVGMAARLAERGASAEGLRAAFAAAERGQARVFLEGLARSRATVLGRVDPRLTTDESAIRSDLRAIEARLALEQVKPVDRRDRAVAERLLADRKACQDRLTSLIARMEREFPQYAAMRYPRACTVEQARACLADDEVALHYVPGSEASYLLVLDKRPSPGAVGIAIHKLAPAGEIAELVAAFIRPKVLEDTSAALELGTELYRVLLAPASDAIAGKHLIVVPGGALGGLPFELLAEPSREGRRFLAERHRIRYAPSLTALHFVGLWEAQRARPEKSFWALGDPAYGTMDRRIATEKGSPGDSGHLVGRLRGGTRDGSFARLEGTAAEVRRLSGIMGGTEGDALLGPAATEAAVKGLSASGALARYQYIHFACHGVLGLADGAPPGLVLAQTGDQRGEDGLLLFDEVTDLRLNSDLVVLSACQTGLGAKYRAEGISSLGRAFLYAGCRGVVCSLWEVDDTATSDLMAEFYSGLKHGMPAPEALRGARLRMITAGAPPSHWAAFVLIGN